MKKQNLPNNLVSLIAPYFVLAIMLVFFILIFFVFSYVFIAIITIGFILAGIGYLRMRFFQPAQKASKTRHEGRIIDQEKE